MILYKSSTTYKPHISPSTSANIQTQKHSANDITMPQSSRPKIHIRPAAFPADKAVVGELFLAYAQSLPICLDFQNFEDELSALPGKYAEEKGGGVWLAYSTLPSADSSTTTSPSKHSSTSEESNVNGEQRKGDAIGCLALRPFHHARTTTSSSALLSTSTSPTTTTCELKRLYLRPSARGIGASKFLMNVALRKARELGYTEMLLDTLRIMTAARRLYEGYGFEECGSYYDNPNDVLFYRLGL
jgi:GNAT superfamily N-acetyltransferase